jgi:diaminopimelate decarboxylase
MRRLTPPELSAGAVRLLHAGYLSPEEPALLCHDLDLQAENISRLVAAFPARTLHAIAIKANPLVAVLKAAVASGAGLEAASLEEVQLALAAGCDPRSIVFDSPAKSIPELREALALGLRINADSQAELARIHEIGPGRGPSIGLRINPAVGTGTIAATSVAGPESRFGTREDPLPLFQAYPWLNGLHVHVGSQGCGLELLLAGAAAARALQDRLNQALGERRIATLDIGGGLPARYHEESPADSIESYGARLQDGVLPSDTQVITEFGRAVMAPCGWAISRVEYVKEVEDRRYAVLHVGADLMLRSAYHPQNWRHEFLVLDPQGRVKEGPSSSNWYIAGPLCFSGDIIGRELSLPTPEPGDLIVIRDVGAYTLGMWSRHCSRCIPAVIGCEGKNLRVLRRRERPADVVHFWS